MSRHHKIDAADYIDDYGDDDYYDEYGEEQDEESRAIKASLE